MRVLSQERCIDIGPGLFSRDSEHVENTELPWKDAGEEDFGYKEDVSREYRHLDGF